MYKSHTKIKSVIKELLFFNLVFVMLTLTSLLRSQTLTESDDLLLRKNQIGFLDNISVCTWKKGAPACLNISFDDNLSKWKQMSEILEAYGFRGTFFSIAKTWNEFRDSLLIMSAHGHEMGSHSFSHLNLKDLANDTAQIIFELEKSKEMVEDLFGSKCHIFAEPFHGRSELSIALVEKYYHFVRNNSFYTNTCDLLLPYSTLTKDKLISTLNDGLRQGAFIRLYGHSLDGEGSGPISREFFIETLKILQEYSKSKGLWVTSLTDGSLYQKVYQDVSISKNIVKDTLIIDLALSNEEDYIEFDEVSVSIQIPKYYCESIEVPFDSVEMSENSQFRILTFDLSTTRKLTVILKNIYEIQTIDSLDISNLIKIYPNPVVDYLDLYLSGSGIILSKKIYSIDGKLLLTSIDGNNYLNMKSMNPGMYVVEVDAIVDSSECRAKSIIIKK